MHNSTKTTTFSVKKTTLNTFSVKKGHKQH